MKRQKDENKIILKQWVRVFLLLIVIAVMAVSIFSIVKAVNPEATQEAARRIKQLLTSDNIFAVQKQLLSLLEY